MYKPNKNGRSIKGVPDSYLDNQSKQTWLRVLAGYKQAIKIHKQTVKNELRAIGICRNRYKKILQEKFSGVKYPLKPRTAYLYFYVLPQTKVKIDYDELKHNNLLELRWYNSQSFYCSQFYDMYNLTSSEVEEIANIYKTELENKKQQKLITKLSVTILSNEQLKKIQEIIK